MSQKVPSGPENPGKGRKNEENEQKEKNKALSLKEIEKLMSKSSTLVDLPKIENRAIFEEKMDIFKNEMLSRAIQ